MSTPTDCTSDLPRLRARRGFAMALTLGAVVLIGLLIAGVFFVSGQQTASSRNTTVQEQAFRVAEAGLAQSISQWSRTKADANPNAGDSWLWVPTTAVPLPAGTPGVKAPSVRITRLNASLYQIVSEATVGQGENAAATRRVSQLVRMMVPTFNVLGALTVRGATQIGGASQINGNDSKPSGWSCPTTAPAMPGIAIASAGSITTSGSGCTSFNCVNGDPKIEENPLAAHDSTYFTFGDYEWAELVKMATLKITADIKPQPSYNATVPVTCNTSVQTNWGDVNRLIPKGACESYFPIIYYPGNAKLTGGSGQGILLVEGDLEVQGGFVFYGPVVVRGRLRTAGTGGHFNGAVMAANVQLEQNSVLGSAIVSYSSCAIESAIKGTGIAVPVRHRAWSEMQ